MSSQHCLSRDELQRYALGGLSDERSREVAAHVEACPLCEDTIAALDSDSDTMIRLLRASDRLSQYAHDPGYEEARRRVASPTGLLKRKKRGDASEECRDGLLVRDYRLLEKIGEGGMGAVYKALHTKLDRSVAVKLLPARRLTDSQAVARFEREIKAVGKLDHPAIVRATDAGEIDGTWFLAMEWIEGFNLAQLSQWCGPLEEADACDLIRQAASGLQYVHQQGMVHRDIKPSNLMLATDGQVKILDLGLALFDGIHGSVDELTTIGQLMGTLDYMAPEQCDDSHGVDVRSDIYSLGATMYRLLCGRAPLNGPQFVTPLQKLKALATEPIPPITDQGGDVSNEVVDVLDRMLARDVERRYATPADCVEALTPLAEGSRLNDLIARATQAAAEQRERQTADAEGEPPAVERLLDAPIGTVASSGVSASHTVPVAEPRRGRRFRNLVLQAVTTAAVVLAGFAIYLNTGSGQLVVESLDDDVEIVVTRSGRIVADFEVKHERSNTTLAVGQYQVEMKGPSDGLLIDGDTFALQRGGKHIVRITRKGKPSATDGSKELISHLQRQILDAEIALDSARSVYGDDHPRIRELNSSIELYRTKLNQARQLAQAGQLTGLDGAGSDPNEPRYEGQTYSQWLAELKAERSPARLKTAVTSLVAIGQTDHADEIVQEIINLMSRVQDGHASSIRTPDGLLFYYCVRAVVDRAPQVPGVAKMLMGALETRSSSARCFVAETLVELAEADCLDDQQIRAAVPLLIEAADDPSSAARRSIVEALSVLDPRAPGVVQTQEKRLGDEDRIVALTAMLSLRDARASSQELLDFLVEFAKSTDPSWRRSDHLLTGSALRELSRTDGLEFVIEALREITEYDPAADAALVRLAIVLLPDRANPERRLSSDQCTSLLTELERIGPRAKEAIPVVRDMYLSGDVDALAGRVLEAITGNVTLPHAKGKMIDELLREMVAATDMTERERFMQDVSLALSNLRSFPDPSQAAATGLVTDSALKLAREYDWARIDASAHSPCMVAALNMMCQLAPRSGGEVTHALQQELKDGPLNGQLHVLAFFYSHTDAAGPVIDACTKQLITLAESKTESLRRRAIYVLGRHAAKPTDEVRRLFEASTEDESKPLRCLAKIVLATRFDETQYMVELLEEDDPAMAAQAMSTLDFPWQRCVDKLVEMLEEDSPRMRQAVRPLRIDPFQESDFPQDLGGAEEAADPSEDVAEATLQELAIKCLSRVGKPLAGSKAVPLLQRFCNVADAPISELAFEALAKIDHEAIHGYPTYDGKTFMEWRKELGDTKPETLTQAIDALGNMAKSNKYYARDTARLIIASSQPHWRPRGTADGDSKVTISRRFPVHFSAAAAICGLLDCPDVVQTIVEYCRGEDEERRTFAFDVLSMAHRETPLPRECTEPIISALVQRSQVDQDPGHVLDLALGVDSTHASIRDRCHELLDSEREEDVRWALHALVSVEPDHGTLAKAFLKHIRPGSPYRAQVAYWLGLTKDKSPETLRALLAIAGATTPDVMDAVDIIVLPDTARRPASAALHGLGFESMVSTEKDARGRTVWRASGRTVQIASAALKGIDPKPNDVQSVIDTLLKEIGEEERTPNLTEAVAIFRGIALQQSMWSTAEQLAESMDQVVEKAKSVTRGKTDATDSIRQMEEAVRELKQRIEPR